MPKAVQVLHTAKILEILFFRTEMEKVFPPIFLRDLSKLETDSKTGKLLFANKVSIDYLTVFGVIVDVEETSQGDWNIQIGLCQVCLL
jgi:hypothetical protein